ncbi:uncharacterized protein BDW47DRAFT_118368 [Aspergillus candidus]|uniref:F-box domain-containing protein n=1 Tax=Aspergillus candidus TaxID=41067 RepID=A0A2I2F898_ASPCN|nr:hypothetical protein BDW47DRAFT_118368 [Aspergillus candidus]PLB36849.1 hypothetical protein BDW47DRAFT_118368 [Aspergillus candidus]
MISRVSFYPGLLDQNTHDRILSFSQAARSETVAKMTLEDLPNELLLLIAAYNDNHGNTLSLAQCCRRFYFLLRQEIYTSIDFTYLCPWALSRLTHTIIEHPELAQSVRKLSMGVRNGYCPKSHRPNTKYHAATLLPAVSAAAHTLDEQQAWQKALQCGQIDPWTALLLPLLPNLSQLKLKLDYPASYLNRMLERAVRGQKPFDTTPPFPALEQVSATWHDHENGIFSSRLLPFFSFPAMRRFQGHMVVEDHIAGPAPELLKRREFSGVTDIDLTAAHAEQGLGYLLRACRGLKSFRYVHAHASISLKDFNPARFHRALEPHRETLERLEFRLDDGLGWGSTGSEREDDFFGPLAGFTALREVALRAANIVDWSKGDDGSFGALAGNLPRALRVLALDQFDQCDMGVMVAQLEDLVGCAKDRFPDLGLIEIQGDLHDAGRGGRSMKEEVVGVTERLRGLCSEAGIDCRWWNREGGYTYAFSQLHPIPTPPISEHHSSHQASTSTTSNPHRMVFYNLVFYRGDHWHESNKPNGGRDNRYLIIASTRSKADLLYRVLQENKSLTGGRKFHELKRLSPQMWSWCGDGPKALYDAIEKINIGTAEVVTAETKQMVLAELRGHVFFQFLDAWDTLPLGFPVLRADEGDVADRMNGGRFCVRSRRWPRRFWALHRGSNSCAIVVSEWERAVFRVCIEGVERETAEKDGKKDSEE